MPLLGRARVILNLLPHHCLEEAWFQHFRAVVPNLICATRFAGMAQWVVVAAERAEGGRESAKRVNAGSMGHR